MVSLVRYLASICLVTACVASSFFPGSTTLSPAEESAALLREHEAAVAAIMSWREKDAQSYLSESRASESARLMSSSLAAAGGSYGTGSLQTNGRDDFTLQTIDPSYAVQEDPSTTIFTTTTLIRYHTIKHILSPPAATAAPHALFGEYSLDISSQTTSQTYAETPLSEVIDGSLRQRLELKRNMDSGTEGSGEESLEVSSPTCLVTEGVETWVFLGAVAVLSFAVMALPAILLSVCSASHTRYSQDNGSDASSSDRSSLLAGADFDSDSDSDGELPIAVQTKLAS